MGFKEIEKFKNYLLNSYLKLSSTAEVINQSGKVELLEGIGEVKINNVEYQIQIVFQPNKVLWTEEQATSIRDTDSDQLKVKARIDLKNN
tara:strand:- start:1714 stop:1983 length:270 start_codon:yes stop_codon:yes gene_type:complete